MFTRVTNELMGKELKFSAYRHYTQFASVRLVFPASVLNLKALANDPAVNLLHRWKENSVVKLALLPLQETLMKQAGHASQTGMLQYAVEPQSHISVPHSQMEQFFAASKVWHQILHQPLDLKIVEALGIDSKSNSGSRLWSPNSFISNHGSFECKGGDECRSALLKEAFGFDGGKFKSETQKKAIDLLGNDSSANVLGVLPTGGGKTLIAVYPVVASLHHRGFTAGFTFVVSPLTSLRNSQVSRLLSMDEALPQPSAIVWQDLNRSYQLLQQCYATPCVTSIQFIFVTPEAVEERNFKEFYKSLIELKRVDRIVVDEVHNVITAKIFRKAYGNLSYLWNDLHIPVTLLTATMPQNMEADLKKSLKLGNSNLAIIRAQTVSRRELSFAVKKCKDGDDSLKACVNLLGSWIVGGGGSALVYVSSRNESEENCGAISKMLTRSELSMNVRFYHAGLDKSKKEEFEKWWFEEEIHDFKIGIVTTAFGEGLDHPSISMVIHLGLYYSMINGFQVYISNCFSLYISNIYMFRKGKWKRCKEFSCSMLQMLVDLG